MAGAGNGLQWVDRTVVILESVAKSPNGMRITELSELHDIPKSTLHRILNALKAYEFIMQDPDTKRYSIGPALLQLGMRFLEQFPLREILRPYLHRLASRTHLASFSALLANDRIICADTVVGDYGPLSLFVRVGRTLPINTSSASKAILAFQPESKVVELLEKNPLQRYTPYTKTQVQEILEELEKVRERGFATSFEEAQVGTFSLSVPIFGPKQQVLASISVVGPASASDPDSIAALEATLKLTAQEICADLGYPYPVPDGSVYAARTPGGRG